MNQLAVRPRFFQKESLSSILFRIAKLNGLTPLSLLNLIKHDGNKHFLQKSDINTLDFVPTNLININKLSQITELTTEEILQGTFYFALGTLTSTDRVENCRLMAGVLRDYLCYCPDCLKESKYNRLLWKINDINICLKHANVLLKTCSHCGKVIEYKDLAHIGFCPHCLADLGEGVTTKVTDSQELSKQNFLCTSWMSLITPNKFKLSPAEIALKVLYILSCQENSFNRAEISIPCEQSVISTLLQHARRSLSQKRTLHISFLLSMLYNKQLSMNSFLKMDVPNSFRNSVLVPKKQKISSVSCQAPWCENYGATGSLAKTGTSYKNHLSGESLHYYLSCSKCGCEYAFNHNEELQERTYFIEGYIALKELVPLRLTLKELSIKSGLTEDKIRRCLAYFKTRGILGKTDVLDKDLLSRFLKAIDRGEKIKTIEKWDCWVSYEHFLAYRFHSAVLLSLRSKKDKRPTRIDRGENQAMVHKLLVNLLENDIDISLNKVASMLGINPETLRNWGCNSIIANFKADQKSNRKAKIENLLYEKVDQYFENHTNRRVTSKELYHYLGKGRTVLWRVMPKVTSYIKIKLQAQRN